MNNISYEEFIKVVETEKTVNLLDVDKITEQIILYSDDFDEYENSNRKKLYHIASLFENKDLTFIGTADNFHNTAVSYAKHDLYDISCKILECGINKIPYSSDLLADYIKYGMSCGQIEKCNVFFERLQNIPKERWSWRAFSFSIDYLLEKCNYIGQQIELNNIKRKALSLADMLIDRKSGKLDQAYFDKATIYREFAETEEELRTLRLCMKSINSSPKCALRLADIAFEKGDYATAIENLKHCCSRINPQPDIRNDYAFLLLGLSKTSALFDKNKNFEGGEDDILSIYKDMHTALINGLVDIYKNTANTIIKILSAQSGIKYPYDDLLEDDEFEF